MRKADYGRNGCINIEDIERWSVESPVEYEFLEDLFNFAPDFIDKHRSIIINTTHNHAEYAPSRPPNNNMQAQRQSPER